MTPGARVEGNVDALDGEAAALAGAHPADAHTPAELQPAEASRQSGARQTDPRDGRAPAGAASTRHVAVTQPAPSAPAPGMQASVEDAWAAQTAARGFRMSQALGALLMVYSFTHLYVFGLRPGASVVRAFVVAGVTLVVGALMWGRSRVYAQRLDMPQGRRWQAAVDLFAYTAMVFWLLFLVALWLTSRGVALF